MLLSLHRRFGGYLRNTAAAPRTRMSTHTHCCTQNCRTTLSSALQVLGVVRYTIHTRTATTADFRFFKLLWFHKKAGRFPSMGTYTTNYNTAALDNRRGGRHCCCCDALRGCSRFARIMHQWTMETPFQCYEKGYFEKCPKHVPGTIFMLYPR